MPFWVVTALSALGVFAGANLSFQAVVNAQLRAQLGSPLRASLVSYIGGLLFCILALLLTRQSLNIWQPAVPTSWWLWTGGLYGLVYLTIAIWLIPLLGSAPVVALIVAGQMIAAAAFDNAGLFGSVRPIDASKLVGIAFLIAGAILVRR